ncbi:MAG: hypothetical protein QOE55_8516 [Acidobacteriaceae bacterium]|jgi:hypothetical protein|nr:hypothetical protein [Acidobacteriaceae bacterium]
MVLRVPNSYPLRCGQMNLPFPNLNDYIALLTGQSLLIFIQLIWSSRISARILVSRSVSVFLPVSHAWPSKQEVVIASEYSVYSGQIENSKNRITRDPDISLQKRFRPSSPLLDRSEFLGGPNDVTRQVRSLQNRCRRWPLILVTHSAREHSNVGARCAFLEGIQCFYKPVERNSTRRNQVDHPLRTRLHQLTDDCRQVFGWCRLRIHLGLPIFEKFDKHPTTVAADVLARLSKPQKRHTNPR